MTAKWVRVPWSGDVVATLGPLISEIRERVEREMSLGTAQAYVVEADGYRGVGALRFENSAAGLVLRVLAVVGVGVDQWARDLVRIARQAGAVAIIANAESAAHVRLYSRLGFEVVAADLRMELS